MSMIECDKISANRSSKNSKATDRNCFLSVELIKDHKQRYNDSTSSDARHDRKSHEQRQHYRSSYFLIQHWKDRFMDAQILLDSIVE